MVCDSVSVCGTVNLLVPSLDTQNLYMSFLWSVECYSNHIITRISNQTAELVFGGTGLCTYRVRGVDGSCAEHLTVEPYMVFICLSANSHTYCYLVFHHSLTPLSFQV